MKKEKKEKKKGEKRIFYFKQKTAYGIKECDWSSDVCSSDLSVSLALRGAHPQQLQLSSNSNLISLKLGDAVTFIAAIVSLYAYRGNMSGNIDSLGDKVNLQSRLSFDHLLHYIFGVIF